MNIYNNMDGLEQENVLLKQKIQELEERLKKYTNGDNHKRYYEKNKDKVKEIGANYLNKLKEENPEKLKEYRRTYYLKKKEKMKQDDQNNNNI
jgi:predicted MPP superfamily phosphohydrolase